MDLKNGVTKTKVFFLIRDNNTGYYLDDTYFRDGNLLSISFSPKKERASKFEQHSNDKRIIESLLSLPFDLKLIKVTKTLIEFDNEEDVE